MRYFKEWLLFREASMSDDALLNYYLHIHRDPRLDDVLTLIKMLEQAKSERNSPIVARILESLKRDTLSKMSKEE